MSVVSVLARAGIAACAVFLSVSAANATVTNFDFTGGANTAFANGTLSIPSVDGGVTFYGFDFDKRNNSWGSSPTPVAHTADGIGVWSREEYANDQNHPLAPYTDSYTSLEYLVMRLPTAGDWTPVSATFNFLNQQNFSIFGYDDTTGGSFLSTGAAFSGILADLELIGQQPTTSGDTFEFADGLSPFEYIVFTTTSTNNNDNRFFVSGFEGQTGVVPVPAALPLLLSALGGFGFLGFMRRRRAAA